MMGKCMPHKCSSSRGGDVRSRTSGGLLPSAPAAPQALFALIETTPPAVPLGHNCANCLSFLPRPAAISITNIIDTGAFMGKRPLFHAECRSIVSIVQASMLQGIPKTRATCPVVAWHAINITTEINLLIFVLS